MVKIAMNKNLLQIYCPMKTEVHLNALNYIALEECDYFLKVKYKTENNKQVFEYSIDSDLALKHRIAAMDFEECMRLLNDYCTAAANLEEKQYDIKNIRLDINCIFISQVHYQFLYFPIIGGKAVPLKKSIKEILSHVHTKNDAMRIFLNEVRKCKTNEETLKYCREYVSQNLHLITQQQEGETEIFSEIEGETTILSEVEGETTILSEVEGETTILSEIEGETTVLLQQESETTILSEAGSETTIMPQSVAYSETTVLTAASTEINMFNDWDYEKTTKFLQNELSESETTLFSLQQTEASGKETDADESEGERSVLSIINNQTGEQIIINKNIFTIGKDEQNMDYAVHNNSISRSHATITYEQNSYYIMDNKSTNGTMMEGVMLQPYEKAELYDGSIITLGNVGLQIKIERGKKE
ncbi:MAG: FHA domain-containing protein [Lachnospiraceae bacterium]|nr:FHA domain-containing protein [Lachnospiraceae bacterium]